MRRSERPRLWPVIIAFFAALMGMLLANALLLGVVMAFYYTKAPNSVLEAGQRWALSLGGLSASAAVTGLALVFVSVAGGLMAKEGLVARVRLSKGRLGVLRIIAAALTTFAAGLVFGQVADLLGFADTGVLALISQSINEASLPAWAMSLVGLAFVPGIAEELFFRGFVQTRAVQAIGKTRGIILAAVFFGLFHMDLKQGTYAMLVGFFLGWVAERAESIRPTMIAHGVSNFLGLCVARAHIGPSETPGKIALLVGSLVVVVGGIAAIAFDRRGEAPPPATGSAESETGSAATNDVANPAASAAAEVVVVAD